jgi:general nucleoside transport system permease protein
LELDMTDIAGAPMPTKLAPEVTREELGISRRFERRQGVGALFGVLGIVLAAVVAPSITSDDRSFAFEAPPDPLTWTFDPQVLVATIGVIYVITGVLSFLPVRFDRVAFWAQILSAALAVPLVLALGLALSTAPSTNVTNLLDESLVLCTPIALGAMTGLWCERSGIINIGIEGMMLGSAGVGFMVYAIAGDASSKPWLWISIFVAMCAGALLSALHAVLSIRYQINQIVSGVVINLFALGLTGFLRSEVIVPSGNSKGVATSQFGIPLLKEIPILGETVFTGGPIHFAMYAIVLLSWFVMYRTPWGLRVRSCGENPHAAETLGIGVIKIRYEAVILGGFIAGLAGAWFSMEAQAGFEDNMTNNAGFIALAALIFGKWTPFGAFGGALLFGFSRALGSRLQFLGVEIGGFSIPSEFFQSLPFFVTLVVVAGALGRAVAPAAEGQPYTPSK